MYYSSFYTISTLILCAFLTLIPSLIGDRFITPRLKITSPLLRIGAALLISQMVLGMSTCLVANGIALLWPGTGNVLFMAVFITLATATIWAHRIFSKRSGAGPFLPRLHWIEICFLTAAIAVSWLLYEPHLALQDGVLFRSPIYWDFTSHFPMIQNFAIGDNFPTTNEQAAGLPLCYHYLFDLLVASYSACGLNLVSSILWLSVLGMTSLLLIGGGMCKELFNSHVAAAAIFPLMIVSTSLRWTYELYWMRQLGWWWAIQRIGNLTDPNRNVAILLGETRYNSRYFSLFYFMEERHLIFGCAMLLLSVFVVLKREQFSTLTAFLAGTWLGSIFWWHAFVGTLTLVPTVISLVFKRGRRQTVCILLVQAALALLFKVHTFNNIRQLIDFDANILNYPQLNFAFSDFNQQRSTLETFFSLWIFALGLSPIVFVFGLRVLRERQREAAWIIAATVIAGFLLVNSFQAMANDLAENHKWLKPTLILFHVGVAGGFAYLWRAMSLVKLPAALIVTFAMLAGGILEVIPYLRVNASLRYATYPSSLMKLIWENTEPRAVFVTRHSREVLLAGRRTFTTSQRDLAGVEMVLTTLRYNWRPRLEIERSLYRAETLEGFCDVAQKNGINVVEFDQRALPAYASLLKRFDNPEPDRHRPSTFVLTSGCQ